MSNGGDAQTPKKIKVVVLGGGPAGVAAAFWLSSQPQYDITLYSQGWRLGGKCATGRNLAEGKRIEEHGLHMLMGCYDNAFRTIRACYAAWQPPPASPFRDWTGAFTVERQMTLMEQDGPGTPASWAPWDVHFPQFPGTPGDAATEDVPREQRIELRLADWLEHYLPAHLPPDLVAGYGDACNAFRLAVKGPSIEHTNPAVERLRRINERIETAIPARKAGPETGSPGSGATTDATLRRTLILANLGLAIAAGIARDVLPQGQNGYELLNEHDFRAWLGTCGASATALAAAPIRALYDLAFAFPGGDASSIDNGAMAAGVTLRFAMEATFGYKDAPLWRMNAGMAETLFTPFYQVLQSRGVTIRLFGRVKALALAGDGTLGRVTIAQQAAFVKGSYQPFVEVKDLQCWPDEPLWDQLVDGAELKARGVDFEYSGDDTEVGELVLQSGSNFDVAILALPPEVIKSIGQGLLAASASWQNAISSSASVATQALQLWMRPSLARLGWKLGPTVVTAYREPYDSWADMSHLLQAEAWSAAGAPQCIAYFCGCIDISAMGPPNPNTLRAAAAREATKWLNTSIGALWPAAVMANGDFDQKLAVSRYLRVNFDGSELYVQTPPGSVKSRLSASEVQFGNLYVAGDWTLTRFSGGCFESAIESGMLAAAAISGQPTNIVVA